MSRTAQYLVAIYERERSADAPVGTGRLADALDRSPSAATEMVERLESRGLVEHEPYEGVTLTPAGRERAAELHETYEVLRRFLRDVLGVDDYEREAFRLAGGVSPTVATRLDETLLPDESDSREAASNRSPASEG